MPRWRLSLPLPAAPTSPSRLHRSLSPIAVDLPSRHPLMSSCSRAIHYHPLPSITVHCHAVHHRQGRHHAVLIHSSPLQSQSIAVVLVLSLTVHHHQRALMPSIAAKEPSRRPLPSHRTIYHRGGAVHGCQSIYCFQVPVAPSITVHRC